MLPQLKNESYDMDVMHRIIIDEEDEERESTICIVGAIICRYYSTYMHEEPCMNMDSFQTGNMWLLEILRGHEKRCVNIFRMDKNTLISLCGDLQRNYGLDASGRMTVLEKVGMFLYILAGGASNRQVQERFQHSGETVSRNFHDVLKAMLCFSFDLIKPQDPTFSTIPPEILNDERYMPYFKDCIGAIDGTHVPACVKEEDLVRFVGRYGIPTQNIMAACSFDMQFTFVLAGWEGTTHDEQLFQHAIREKVINFPMPPSGKYYLVNAGYSQIEGYLGPYKGTRYHLSDFQHDSQPREHKEIFNRWHSSLRSCMERTFGVWKVRWKILQRMNPYPFEVQRDIVIASMALHNYIRRKALADPAFIRFDQNPDFVPHDAFQNVKDYEQNGSHQDNEAAQMNELRDEIAFSLMRARTQY